jgi:SNF family Na+-dependent transporter
VTTISTFGLGFNALPNVFARMPGGQFFGFLWFFMLFLAALTSSVSMLQPVIAFLEEGFGLKRHASTAILGLITTIGGGYVVFFSKDLVALDTFDFWIGTMLIFILAIVQAILYGWIFGIERGHAEAHQGAHIRIPWFVQLAIKYVVPMYLLAIFIGTCIQKGPEYVTNMAQNPVALSSFLFLVVIFVFLQLMVHIAGRRWEKEGRYRALAQQDAGEQPS